MQTEASGCPNDVITVTLGIMTAYNTDTHLIPLCPVRTTRVVIDARSHKETHYSNVVDDCSLLGGYTEYYSTDMYLFNFPK